VKNYPWKSRSRQFLRGSVRRAFEQAQDFPSARMAATFSQHHAGTMSIKRGGHFSGVEA